MYPKWLRSLILVKNIVNFLGDTKKVGVGVGDKIGGDRGADELVGGWAAFGSVDFLSRTKRAIFFELTVSEKHNDQ